MFRSDKSVTGMGIKSPIFWAPKGTVTVSYCRNGLQSITLAAEEL